MELEYSVDYGECDECDVRFDVGSAIDHCGVCGNCWNDCSCNPKRTLEDNWADFLIQSASNPDWAD